MLVKGSIFSRNNLTLCQANYFETCWCSLNSTEPITCPYLLRHVISLSNSSYFCVYHTIRQTIDCFNSTFIFISKTDSTSLVYIYLTIILFIIGIIGNGLSIVILFNKKLRRLSVYRNLTILCALNIFYLLAILIRHTNHYHQDLRNISPKLCQLHTFIVAFTGHLCSWQLVSTSIQRVFSLLSLQSHSATSWIRTLAIFFICIVLPLFIFDAQLLFNYGLLYKHSICETITTYESKQIQRAMNFPINNPKFSNNIPLRYYTNFFQTQIIKPNQCSICILWNILDTLVYAIIPFLIILTTSIIIIVNICTRRRSAIMLGAVCYKNRRMTYAQDNLSILLITINFLFLIMTGPFNIVLTIQSIIKYFFSQTSSMKNFIKLNEYLRSLQNSYHALSFIFYCITGNKFRSSAWSICQIMYCKLCKIFIGHQQTESSIILCCLDRKRSTTNGITITTTSNDNYNNHNHTRMINLTPIYSTKSNLCITAISIEKKTRRSNSFV